MSDTSDIVIITPEDENAEPPTAVTLLEMLAIQAMMNPSSEEVDEPLFEFSGKAS